MPTWYFANNAGSTSSTDPNNWWTGYNGDITNSIGGTGTHPTQAIANIGGLASSTATGSNSFVVLGSQTMVTPKGTNPTLVGTIGDSWTNYGTVLCCGNWGIMVSVNNLTLHNYGTLIFSYHPTSWYTANVMMTLANGAHLLNHANATLIFGGAISFGGSIDASSTFEAQANSVLVMTQRNTGAISAAQSLYGTARFIVSNLATTVISSTTVDPSWIVSVHGGTYAPNYPDSYSVAQGAYYGDAIYGYQWGQMPDYSGQYYSLLYQTYNLRFPDPSNIINNDYYVDLWGNYYWGYGQQIITYTGLTPTQEATLNDLYAVVSTALPATNTALGDLQTRLASFVTLGMVTLNWQDAASQPVPGVTFNIHGQGAGRADTYGAFTTSLADGTYTVYTAPRSGVLFAPAALTVTGGTAALTIQGVALPDPGTPGQVQFYVYTPAPGYRLGIQMLSPPPGQGHDFDAGTTFVTSDGTGLWTYSVWPGASYRIFHFNGVAEQVFSVPVTQTTPFTIDSFVL